MWRVHMPAPVHFVVFFTKRVLQNMFLFFSCETTKRVLQNMFLKGTTAAQCQNSVKADNEVISHPVMQLFQKGNTDTTLQRKL